MVLLNRRSMRRLVYGLGLTSIVLVFVGLQVVGKDGGLKATDDYSLGDEDDRFLEKYQSSDDDDNSDETYHSHDPLEEIVLQNDEDEKAEKHKRGVKMRGEDDRNIIAQQSHLVKEIDKSRRSSDQGVDNNDEDDQNADGEIKTEDKRQDTNLYIQEDLLKINQITDRASKIGDLGSQGFVGVEREPVAKRPSEPNLQVKDHKVHDTQISTSNHDSDECENAAESVTRNLYGDPSKPGNDQACNKGPAFTGQAGGQRDGHRVVHQHPYDGLHHNQQRQQHPQMNQQQHQAPQQSQQPQEQIVQQPVHNQFQQDAQQAQYQNDHQGDQNLKQQEQPQQFNQQQKDLGQLAQQFNQQQQDLGHQAQQFNQQQQELSQRAQQFNQQQQDLGQQAQQFNQQQQDLGQQAQQFNQQQQDLGQRAQQFNQQQQDLGQQAQQFIQQQQDLSQQAQQFNQQQQDLGQQAQQFNQQQQDLGQQAQQFNQQQQDLGQQAQQFNQQQQDLGQQAQQFNQQQQDLGQQAQQFNQQQQDLGQQTQGQQLQGQQTQPQGLQPKGQQPQAQRQQAQNPHPQGQQPQGQLPQPQGEQPQAQGQQPQPQGQQPQAQQLQAQQPQGQQPQPQGQQPQAQQLQAQQPQGQQPQPQGQQPQPQGEQQQLQGQQPQAQQPQGQQPQPQGQQPQPQGEQPQPQGQRQQLQGQQPQAQQPQGQPSQAQQPQGQQPQGQQSQPQVQQPQAQQSQPQGHQPQAETSHEPPDDIPILMWWTEFTHEPWKLKQCGKVKCYLTEQRKHLDDPRTKVLIFYGTDFSVQDMPVPKRHEWALLHEESPKNNYMYSQPEIMELFNHTSTFKRESDYPIPLQFLKSVKQLESRKYMMSVEEKNKRLKDFALVNYVQSDCGTPSDRDHFVQMMQKFLTVDSYGACLHNKDLPENIRDPLRSMLKEEFFRFLAQYKFTITMENAVCDDYMTEKLWRPFIAGTVPIVFGSPKVKDFLPSNHSAILVSDYTNMAELVNHLLRLNSSDEEYNKYLEYKKTGVQNQYLRDQDLARDWNSDQEAYNPDKYYHFIEGFECFICQRVHENQKRIKQGLPPLQYQATVDHYGCPKPKRFSDNPMGNLDRVDDDVFAGEYIHGLYEARVMRNLIESGRTMSYQELAHAAIKLKHEDAKNRQQNAT